MANMGMIEGFIINYKAKKGTLPSTAEGLEAADIPADLNLDFWGRPFIYRFPGKHNIGSHDLYSLGKDGFTGTDGADPDDINNWEESEPWREYYAASFLPKAFWGIGGVLLTLLAVWFIRSKLKTANICRRLDWTH